MVSEYERPREFAYITENSVLGGNKFLIYRNKEGTCQFNNNVDNIYSKSPNWYNCGSFSGEAATLYTSTLIATNTKKAIFKKDV